MKELEDLKLEDPIFENKSEDRSYIHKDKSKEKDKDSEKKGLWNKMFNKNKLKKSTKVAVIYLRDNKIAEPMEKEVDSKGFFNINGRVYHQDRDCIYLLGKDRHPFAIIPEFNVTPIGTKEWYSNSMQKKFAVLQDHVMKGIRHAERVRMGEKGEGMKLNPKTIIVFGIIAIVAVALIMNYA